MGAYNRTFSLAHRQAKFHLLWQGGAGEDEGIPSSSTAPPTLVTAGEDEVIYFGTLVYFGRLYFTYSGRSSYLMQIWQHIHCTVSCVQCSKSCIQCTKIINWGLLIVGVNNRIKATWCCYTKNRSCLSFFFLFFLSFYVTSRSFSFSLLFSLFFSFSLLFSS